MKIVALGLTILAAIVGLANSKRCGQEEGGEITELLLYKVYSPRRNKKNYRGELELEDGRCYYFSSPLYTFRARTYAEANRDECEIGDMADDVYFYFKCQGRKGYGYRAFYEFTDEIPAFFSAGNTERPGFWTVNNMPVRPLAGKWCELTATSYDDDGDEIDEKSVKFYYEGRSPNSRDCGRAPLERNRRERKPRKRDRRKQKPRKREKND